MPRLLAQTTFLVDDYDRALDFFTRVMRFRVLEDTPLEGGKRWIRVAPGLAGEGGALLLARAANPAQTEQVGRAAGGRVAFFLEVDDHDAERRFLEAATVRFEAAARDEAYGRVSVFVDLWGNRWDLIGPPGDGLP